MTVTDAPSASQKLWTALRDVSAFAAIPGDVWRISVKPSDAPAVIAALPAKQTQLDWGGGLIWAVLPAGHDPRPSLSGLKGHATRVRANAPGPTTFHPEPAPVAAITQGLRARFDPRGILNPGLMTK